MPGYKPIIASVLALAFVASIAVAQRAPAPAPVAPVKAVPLYEAVQGLVEMCTDYAGKAETPLTQDRVRTYFPEDKTNSLGIVLRWEGDSGYDVRATTTAGVIRGTILVSGSSNSVNAVCMFSALSVNKTNFAGAFTATFDNMSGYARAPRPPLQDTSTIRWRGPQVLASVMQSEQYPATATARIGRASDQALRTGGSVNPCEAVNTLAVTSAPPAGSEHWDANAVGFAPWTFDLKITAGSVTGVIGQASSDPATSTCTTLTGPFEIYDGKVSGNAIAFKAEAPGGGRVITFRGVRNGDSIAFNRTVQVISDNPGRNGILGGTGATEFVAKRGAAAK